jgi:hypothetical protein
MAEKTARCVNCHFLGANSHSRQHGESFIEIGTNERESLKSGAKTTIPYGYLYCYHNIWSARNKGKNDNTSKLIREVDREKSCFFWNYSPDMMPEAVATLQKRDADRAQLATERRLTTFGLLLAAVALSFTACFSLINIVIEVLKAFNVIQP